MKDDFLGFGKVVLFFIVPGRNVPNGKFVFHFFKPSLIPLSGLRSCFLINGNELYKNVNAAIPGRNLPVLNFCVPFAQTVNGLVVP